MVANMTTSEFNNALVNAIKVYAKTEGWNLNKIVKDAKKYHSTVENLFVDAGEDVALANIMGIDTCNNTHWDIEWPDAKWLNAQLIA